MFHGYRRWVCSLACVFSILCMLFLDTCIVEASGGNQVYNGSYSISIAPDVDGYTFPSTFSFTERGTTTSTGTTSSSGSGSVSNQTVKNNSYQAHFKVPIVFRLNVSDFGITDYSPEKLYSQYILLYTTTASVGTMSNVYLTDSEGTLLANLSNPQWKKWRVGTGYALYNSNVLTQFQYNLFLEFDYSYFSNSLSTDPTITFTVNTQIQTALWDATSDELAQSQIEVNDSQANESLDNVEQSTQSTADNTSGILSKITDFFGSFFENLIGIFVPEDGYFSTWFDRVNTLLSAKLGMLYAPFDLVISTLQAIYSADSTESGIPFPGIKWEDTWLVEPFTFTFDSLGSDFDDLREKVYFATDTVLVLTFLMLLQSKVKLILEGHE